MKINKSISAIIIFIITLILIFLFVVPEYKKLNNLQSDLARKQAEYNGKFIYYAKIADIIKSIESKRDALGKINSALPSDFYLSSLVYFFQKEGAKTGLTMTSMTLSPISPATKDSDIKNIIFSIHMSGTYEGFKGFLSSLDKSARLFEVNSISFSTPAISQNKTQSQVYDFSIEVQTHAY